MTPECIPKREWGQGPWQDEPDEVRWIDQATKKRCAVLRDPVYGSLAGFVEISHPDLCKPFPELNVIGFAVHGGISYSGPLFSSEGETGWWLGFECHDILDVAPALAALHLAFRRYRRPALGQLVDKLAEDGLVQKTYRDLAYVKSECAWLATQINRHEATLAGLECNQRRRHGEAK